MKKASFICVSCALLINCSGIVPDENNGGTNNLATQSYYSLNTTRTFNYRYTRSDGSISYTNFSAPKFQFYPQDLIVEIYELNSVPCSSSITGASQTKVISDANGYAAWGRMDAWDGRGLEGWEYPVNWEQIICKQEGTPLPTSVYAFCAEKDERTVVICMNQMTDNPQLAEEIFNTFRWRE
ncbi:MAG: hypothetical protein WCV62_05515 [Candidatus Peribacteraceae bacterium]